MLLFPHWTGNYGASAHFAKKVSQIPPVNLAYLAAIAERKNFDVRIIDGQVEDMNLERVIEEAQKFNPGIVGLTSTTPFHHYSEETARGIKKAMGADVITAIGGTHITVTKSDPSSLASDAFDFGFIGEADNSWAEFLERYDLGKSLTETRGIIYRKNGQIIENAPASPVNIDEVPFPARHLLRTDRYEIGTLEGTKNFTSIFTMRGCPFKCTFCSSDVFGYKLRKTRPEKVIEEMKQVINDFGIKHFYFMDDTLTVDKRHFSDICDLIIEEDLGITFEGGTRANLVDEPLIAKMKEAGLIRMTFGLETVNRELRRRIKKEVPIEAYEEANRLTNKYGIETRNSCMIGLPGETRETVRQTLAYLRLSKELKLAAVNIAVPYPGTELAEQAANGEYGLKLLSTEPSDYRRNKGIMQVGDLTPEDLRQIQNDAYLSVYSAPHRLLPMYRRHGLKGVYLTLVGRFMNAIKQGRFPDYLTRGQLGIKRRQKLEFNEKGELTH